LARALVTESARGLGKGSANPLVSANLLMLVKLQASQRLLTLGTFRAKLLGQV
jgi:hypothetical protein